jgi:hypothetical protein
MKTALIIIALLGAIAGTIFVGLSDTVRAASSAQPGEPASAPTMAAEPTIVGAQVSAPAPAAVNSEKAATDGRMTVKSPSYACDSRFEASMFVLMSKGEQHDGASDVAAMFENDVKQGSCERLYPGDAMVVTNDPQVDDKDLSTVKINGDDREYFTPTHLLTHLAVAAAPTPATSVDRAAGGSEIDTEERNARAAEQVGVKGTINRPVQACESHGGDCFQLPEGTRVIVDMASTSEESGAWIEIVNPTAAQTQQPLSTDAGAVTLD